MPLKSLLLVISSFYMISFVVVAQEQPPQTVPHGQPSGRGARPLSSEQLLAEALRLFRSDSVDDIEAAFATLDQVEVNPKLALQLIEAAGGKYRHDAAGVSASMLHKLVGLEDEAIFAALEQHYDKLAEKPDALGSALRIFSEKPDPHRNERLLKLLERESSKSANLGIALFPYGRHQDFPLVFWQRLLSHYERLEDRPGLLLLALQLIDRKKLDPQKLDDFFSLCVRRAAALLLRYQGELDDAQPLLDGETDPDKLTPAQQSLTRIFHELELLCDLFRFVDRPQVIEILQNLVTRQSAKLRAFAAIALLARGHEVAAEILLQIAGKPNARALLWNLLERERRTNLFPQQYYNQAHLAEAGMAQWLEGPEGYGCAPEKIELLRTIEFQEDRIPYDLYLFKFKYPGKEIWHVGVAGAYLPKEPPRLTGPHTGSVFATFDSKSLDKHIEDYLEKPK